MSLTQMLSRLWRKLDIRSIPRQLRTDVKAYVSLSTFCCDKIIFLDHATHDHYYLELTLGSQVKY